MRTILLIILLVSLFKLSFLKGQCSTFTGTTTLVSQGCNGNCGIITATPTGGTMPYSYQFYVDGALLFGATTSSTQVCTRGVYYCKIVDANNCTILTNYIIYNQATTPLSVASIYPLTNYSGFPVSCRGNTDACIKVIPVNGFPNSSNTGYTYDLGTGPSNNDTLCNLGAGSYTITVTDSLGCTTTSSITLAEPNIDSIDFWINTPPCAGTNGWVQILSICGGSCTYAINGNPPQNQMFFSVPSGMHYFEVYNGSGCLINYDSVLIIDPPTPTINAPASICENDMTTVTCQVSGNASSYTYLWDKGETDSVVLRTPGIVMVTVTDVNGCQFNITDTILAIPLLDSVFISSTLDPFGIGHCENADSTILDVNLFSGIRITNGTFYGSGVRNGIGGAGAAIFYPDSAKIDMGHIGDLEITYIYQTTTGCWDTTSFDTRIHALPDLSFINLPDSLCPAEDSFQLKALNIRQLGSTGQFPSPDTLINIGQYTVRDINGNILPNLIQLFDTLYPMIAIGHEQVHVSYSYTSPSLYGLCSSVIEDSIIITDCCVWPGDTDNDGLANNFDLLPIGLHYGNTGLSRSSQTIDYTCHDSDDWNTSISGLPFVDQKHVDCDGNSLINHTDTNAIILNWSQTHLKNASTINAAVTMYVDTTTTNPGDTVVLDIILNQGLVPSANYGLAFTVNYDPLLVDTNTAHVTFDNSSLGLINVNMIGIQKDFYNQGEIEVGLTRIDQTSIIGGGSIAQLHFIIKDDLLPKTLNKRLDLSIDNIRLVDNLGIEIPVTGLTSQVLITEPILGVYNNSLDSDNEIHISPNPASESVYIYSSLETIEEINLYNITGQLVQQLKTTENYTETLDIRVLPTGVYFLDVKTKNFKEVLRIVKK